MAEPLCVRVAYESMLRAEERAMFALKETAAGRLPRAQYIFWLSQANIARRRFQYLDDLITNVRVQTP